MDDERDRFKHYREARTEVTRQARKVPTTLEGRRLKILEPGPADRA
jgi:hypothetical protein